MYACEEEAALQEEEEHVDKAEQVAAGADHRVVPESVHCRPGEIVAVILAYRPAGPLEVGSRMTEEHAAPIILHDQDGLGRVLEEPPVAASGLGCFSFF